MNSGYDEAGKNFEFLYLLVLFVTLMREKKWNGTAWRRPLAVVKSLFEEDAYFRRALLQ